MRVTSDYGPDQRALLQGRATATYRDIVDAGSLSSDDPRFGEDHPDRASVELLVDLGLLALDPLLDAYVPVDPATVQARVVAPMGQQATDLLTESTAWANAFGELGQVFRHTSPGASPVLELRGYANINRFIQAAVGDAQKELLTAQPAGARSAATLEVAVERDIRALSRGIAMRTLYQHSARRSTATREYVERVTAHGAEVRTLDEFFNRLIVVDQTMAIVPGAEGTHVAVAIHDRSLVAYLVDIFERYWERAHDFGDRDLDTARDIADDVHNMTVRMLVEGHSDNASAKRMGVSARTFAGYVAALKEEYGAETRFQLGYAMGLQEAREGRRRRSHRTGSDEQARPGPERN